MSSEIDRIDVARHLLPPPGAEVAGKLIAEIRRLQEAIRRLAEQDATLSVCEGNVTVTMDATFTDAEREALEWAGGNDWWTERNTPTGERHAVTLRGLLERTSATRATPAQGSVQGEGSVPDSRNAKEPVAWAVETGGELEASFCGPAGREDAADWREQSDGVIVPLYRHPAEPCPHVTGKTTRYCTLTPFALTDEEREAIKGAADLLIGSKPGAILRKMLERLT